VLARVKRYAKAADLPDNLCNHSFRGTGITVYLESGGLLEKAQYMAGHAKPETTKLYDRRREMETAGEVDKIAI
jgi:integrase